MFATRAGWLGRHEVTEVWYDPRRLPFAKLLADGVRGGCAQHVWTSSRDLRKLAAERLGDRAHLLAGAEPRPDKDPKYYLGRTSWRHVPMTAAQAARCNAALAPKASGKPETWLSPRQVRWHERIVREPSRPWPVVIGVPLPTAWERVRTASRVDSRR